MGGGVFRSGGCAGCRDWEGGGGGGGGGLPVAILVVLIVTMSIIYVLAPDYY